MKKNIKKLSIIIIFFLFGLLFHPGHISAKSYSSDFISIDDITYTYQDDEVDLSNVHFNDTKIEGTGLKLYGTLFANLTNLSDYYLSVHMIIDYFDANYNIIARSLKIEKPEKEKYIMSISLYEEDFLGQYNFEDIKYFKIKYTTHKANPLPNLNKPSQNNNYNYNYEYVIDSYNIDINVNENNTFDINESIEAYFYVPKHGIYRTIPLVNNITRLDGTKSKNRAKISNVQVNDNYTISKNNGNYQIKIGSAYKTLTGMKEYKVSYNYNIGKDKSKKYDELYFNIIGNEWDTAIGNVTFKITLPKEFDKTKLGFSSGVKGSTDSSKINYTVNGNAITGSYNGILNPTEGLTVRLELPEGYFVGASYPVSITTYLFFLIPIIGLLVSLFIWYKYGKDDPVIETVEFYPPEGFNSLEIGYLYKGNATNEDVTSLLIYLANRGYIKITEKEQKSLFKTTSNFEITKLKEYDGNNANEEMFLHGLFLKSNSTDFRKVMKLMKEAKKNGEDFNSLDAMLEGKHRVETVTSYDLYDNFYIVMNKILKNINSKVNKKKIFETSTSLKSAIITITIIISLLVIIAVPTLEYAGVEELIITLVITLFYVPFYAVGLIKDVPKGFRILWLGFTILHSAIFFMTLPIIDAFIIEPIYLIGFILGIICIILMIICLKFMPKRTPYGNEILGKINGFKTFLETAQKEKLEAMVMQNPTYFYDILPFTYVLGVSKKWISKFETINMKAPDWYDSPTGFNVNNFSTFMNNTMVSAQRSMSSSPSSSSGGSSSGGGSSGGGSGGGGGGSW